MLELLELEPCTQEPGACRGDLGCLQQNREQSTRPQQSTFLDHSRTFIIEHFRTYILEHFTKYILENSRTYVLENKVLGMAS